MLKENSIVLGKKELKCEFLEKFPAFGKMPEALVDKILANSRRQVIPKGRYVCREGEFSQTFAFIMSGEVRVFKDGIDGREITLYEVGAGETCIINALCILAKIPAPANGIAQTACDTILLPAQMFRCLAEKHGIIREYVFGVLSKKFVDIIALVEEIAFEHIDERLIEYLVEKSEDGVLHSTHRKIASDLGTSREVISRLLKDFERKGKLVLSRNFIRLTDPSNIPTPCL